MPRKGSKTIRGTSVPEIFQKLVDRFIKEQKEVFKLRQVKLSRAKVIELAVLQFLERKGVLDKYLAELGYSDSEVRNIRQYLELVV